MAPRDDPAFQQAMDQLLLQVDTENVLAVHRVFQTHADDLRAELQQVRRNAEVGLCGGDPVSPEAAASFNGKIGQLLEVHWKHWEELEAVASTLKETAKSYGKTDEEIGISLTTPKPQ